MSSDLRDDPLLRQVPEVDGYKVLEPCVLFAAIGRGGMGAVYRGRHLNLEVDVAVKCLKSSLAEESRDFVIRFQREARVAAGVNDSNLIRVYDVLHRHGVHYLVMEYVEGENLQTRVSRKGRLGFEEAVTIALGAAHGMATAHEHGIVHRDVKPANILISKRGEVKIADLGLARAADAIDSLETGTNMVLGTPQYMPPEQFESAKSVGKAGDVHALGGCLWFMLAGKSAIPPGSLAETMRRVVLEPYPDLATERSDVPADLLEFVRRATDRDARVRPADAITFKTELEAIARRHGWLVSLRDADAGSVVETMPLVSPPPQATMTRIKVMIESGALSRPGSGVQDSQPTRPSGGDGPTAEGDSYRDHSTPKPAPRPEWTPATEPAQDRPKSPPPVARPASSKRRQQLAGLIGLVLLVAGIVGFFVNAAESIDETSATIRRGAAANDPAKLVPRDLLVFALGVHDPEGVFRFMQDQLDILWPPSPGDPRTDAERLAVISEDLLGLGVGEVRDFEGLGIDSSGLALAAYDGGVEFATFRSKDVVRCREVIERIYRAESGFVVEARSIGSATIIEKKETTGAWVDCFAILRGDVVVLSGRSNSVETANFLGAASRLTLADDANYTSLSKLLPAERTMTVWAQIPANEFREEGQMADFVRSLRGIVGSVSLVGRQLEAELRVGFERGSVLDELLVAGRPSLLSNVETSSAIAALEIGIDPNRVLSFLDRSTARRDLALFERDFRKNLGFDVRRDVFELLDGRFAWVISGDRAGEIILDTATDQPTFFSPLMHFPVDLGYDVSQRMRESNGAMRIEVPRTSLFAGTKRSPSALFDAIDRVPGHLGEDDQMDAIFLVKKTDDGRSIDLTSKRERLKFAAFIDHRDDVLRVGLDGCAVDFAKGGATFLPNPRAVARLFVNVPEVFRRLRSVAGDREVQALFTTVSNRIEPLKVEFEREETTLVGRWEVATVASWSRTAASTVTRTWPTILAALGGLGIVVALLPSALFRRR